MNQESFTHDQQQSAIRSAEFDLIKVLIILAKRKKAVIGLTLTAGLLAAGVSILMPDIFKASTKLLPPQQQQSGTAALLSQISGIAGGGNMKTSTDLYIGMLRSRTVADHLIERHKLKTVYETDSNELARKKLEKDTAITAGKDGIIILDVEAIDRRLATNLANSYVDELVKLSKVLAVTEASKRRLFFEQQLNTAKNDLAKSEVVLKSALERNGVTSIDAESRAVIETMSRLRAQISAKEIQLNAMRAFVTESNPEFLRAQEELSSLRVEQNRLGGGRNVSVVDEAEVPKDSAGLTSVKLLRDVKYYQMLYELLAKQYEAARIDEAKDPAIVQVLDAAIEPERKSKPNRVFIVILGAIIGFALSVVWLVLSEARRRFASSSNGAAQLKELKSNLRF